MSHTARRPTVLFLCTGNSCRSQMAEGCARHLLGERLEACSAGVEAHGLDPRAVQVMAEVGVDISGQRSESVADHVDADVDLVVTVCDHAAESCPVFPGTARVVHHGFPDPAKAAGSEPEVLEAFRAVRDAIRVWVEQWLPALLERRARQ
jgi:arsenate reductase